MKISNGNFPINSYLDINGNVVAFEESTEEDIKTGVVASFMGFSSTWNVRYSYQMIKLYGNFWNSARKAIGSEYGYSNSSDPTIIDLEANGNVSDKYLDRLKNIAKGLAQDDLNNEYPKVNVYAPYQKNDFSAANGLQVRCVRETE